MDKDIVATNNLDDALKLLKRTEKAFSAILEQRIKLNENNGKLFLSHVPKLIEPLECMCSNLMGQAEKAVVLSGKSMEADAAYKRLCNFNNAVNMGHGWGDRFRKILYGT